MVLMGGKENVAAKNYYVANRKKDSFKGLSTK
jgi:hypothetical protein